MFYGTMNSHFSGTGGRKEQALNIIKWWLGSIWYFGGLLKPFQQATTVIWAVRYPTLSTIKPLLYKLLTKTLKIADGECPIAKAVKKEFKKEF